MALKNINRGLTPNDKTGDTARSASQKINENFSYLLDQFSSGYQGTLSISYTPTSDGFYSPTEAGTYTNAGGLVYDPEDTDKGYLVQFIKNGATWNKNKIDVNVDITGDLDDDTNKAIKASTVKEALTQKASIQPGVNLANPNDFITGFLDGAGGVNENEAFGVTGYIPVIAGEDYVSGYKRYASYYSDKNVESFISNDFDFNTNEFTTAPAGAKFARFDFFPAHLNNQIQQGQTFTGFVAYEISLDPDLKANRATQNLIDQVTAPLYSTINNLSNSLDEALTQKASIQPGVNLSNPNDFITGFLDGAGGVNENEAFGVTGYIPVIAGEDYVSGYKRYASYYSDKNVESFISNDFDFNTNEFTTAPAGAKFARFDFSPADLNNQIQQGQTFTGFVPYEISLDPDLKANRATQNLIDQVNAPLYSTINNLSNSLDEATDKNSALFVNQATILKISGCPGLPEVVNIASRDNDHQFTVTPSLISKWDPDLKTFGIVIQNAGRYKVFSCYCADKTNGVILTAENLPSSITSFMLLQDGPLGQHLSLWGYRALSEGLVETVGRYAYKKDTIFDFSAPATVSDGNVVVKDSDGNVVANFLKTSGTLVGGFAFNDVPNSANVGPIHSSENGESIFAKEYTIIQNTAGRGVTLNVKTQNQDSYLEIIIGESVRFNRVPLRVVIKDQDNVEIYTQILRGCSQSLFIDITKKISNIEISFTQETNGNCYWGISQIRLYKKRPTSLEKPLKKEGNTIAFLCDSWGEFTISSEGETSLDRQDGSTSPGLQILSEHLKTYLTANDIDITTFNNSRGGQTSTWGKYWLDQQVLQLPKKPDYCVVNFAINDANSYDKFAASSSSVYDFDPNDPNIRLPFNSGGIFASVDQNLWYNNMISIIETLIENGIKPVVMMPPKLSGINYPLIGMLERYLKIK